MNDITMLSIEKVSKLIEKKELSPVDLTKACLSRINKQNPELNAYVYLAADQAQIAAKKAENEISEGHYRGKLHGIPVAFKDLYYTKGIPTTACSKVLKDFVPNFNGTVVQRLIDAGAIIMGKTNTTEFAFGPTNEESYFGPARNPWNTKKISGGSSGGSAIAVTSGMAYVAMGSDSGGSIRIPAAMCGAVGFKPSIGLVSSYGIVPMSFTMDHPGPLCRSVADAAIVIDAITGTDENDTCPFAIKGEHTNFYDTIANVTDLKGKVFGIPKNFFFDKTDYEVERVFFEAVDRIKALGAEAKEVVIPDLELIPEVSTNIMFSEAAWNIKDLYLKNKENFDEAIASRIETGLSIKAIDYIESVKCRERIIGNWEETLKDLDAVLVPTCPIEAFDIGLGEPWHIITRGNQEMGKPMATYHTRLANMTGAPALSVPAGLTKNGLPVGIMIMGKRNDDCGVLEIGMVYERNYKYPMPKIEH